MAPVAIATDPLHRVMNLNHFDIKIAEPAAAKSRSEKA
jgi:hypothetical protein